MIHESENPSFEKRLLEAMVNLKEEILDLMADFKTQDEIKAVLKELQPHQLDVFYAEALHREMYEVCQVITDLRKTRIL